MLYAYHPGYYIPELASAPLLQAQEADRAQPLGRAKARQLGQAVEGALARSLTAAKSRQLAVAVETAWATELGRVKVRQLVHATEHDTATATSRRKSRQLQTAAEIGVAIPLIAPERVTGWSGPGIAVRAAYVAGGVVAAPHATGGL